MYVITGATGNTGNVVARRLLDKGQKVRVIGRRAENLEPLVAEGAEPSIGKPDLAYVHLSDEQVRPALIQIGLSQSVAELILELSAALNSGHSAALEKRSAQTTTATSYETFAAEEFAPRYRGRVAAAH